MGYGTADESRVLDDQQIVQPEGFGANDSYKPSRSLTGSVEEFRESREIAPATQKRRTSRVLKRAFDLGLGSVMLLVFGPVIILFAILVRMQDGEKAIFSQDRYGLHGKTFKCLKLRSMVPDAKERLDEILASNPELKREWDETQKLVDDPRITKLGRFIRKTSIDELPQLINVLRGEMSLIGPRPIVANEVEKYGDAFSFYSSVKPGITGLWQIKGRSDTSYPERVALDVEYAQTFSFWGDIKICLITVPVLLGRKGAH